MNRCFSPTGEVLIERDHRGCRCGGVGAPDHYGGQTPFGIVDAPVITIASTTLKGWDKESNISSRAKEFWCRSEDDSSWIKARQPDEEGLIRTQFRIDGEIANPKCGPTTRLRRLRRVAPEAPALVGRDGRLRLRR